VGTYGCHFDGLDELDTLGRGEGQEGREGGREGGRTGGEILFEGTLLVGNGLRAFVDIEESTHTVACQEKRRKGGGW